MDELARVQLENKKLRQRCVELDEIEDKLEVYKIESDAARDKINTLQGKYNNIHQENQTLKEKLARFSEDNSILNKKLSEIRGDLLEAKSENQNRELHLKQDGHEQITDIKNLELQLKEALQENEELHECLATADKLVEKHVQEKEELLKELEKSSNQKPKSEAKETNSQIQELTQKLFKANASADKCMKENEKLQKKLDEQNSTMEKMVQVHKEQLQTLAQEQLGSGKSDDEAMKVIILENKKMRKKYKKIKEELAAAQKEIEELRAKSNG